MRTLVSIGVFEERGERLYAHSALSKTLLDPAFRTLVVGMYVEETSTSNLIFTAKL